MIEVSGNFNVDKRSSASRISDLSSLSYNPLDFLYHRFIFKILNGNNFFPTLFFLDIDTKSINADVSETDDQNNDTHSYLTISDRSDRLYAAVHYDEAEDRKSSSPISLRSIKEHYTSESDNSKASESYLTPLINDVEELKGDSPRSSDYEDVTTFKM